VKKVLILGGTTEARLLAGRLARRADLSVTVSLAGRVSEIVPHPVPVRIGGFGGLGGLVRHLAEEKIDVLIDATHPYADTISQSAVLAAGRAGVAFVALRRLPWVRQDGDQWREVESVAAAIEALGTMPRRVFLTLGRQEIAAVTAGQHFYLVRSIEPIEPPLPLPHVRYLVARGPFAEADETWLLRHERIDAVVCRNSGGAGAYAKIAAARALGIEVLMIRRPELAEAPSVGSVAEAEAWLDHVVTATAERGV